MKTLELHIPVAEDGTLLLKQAVGRLLGEERAVECERPLAISAVQPIVRLHQHVAPSSATRRLLEVLPGGEENGLTPEQLGSLLGDPALSKGSVRAVIRNAKRAETGMGGQVGDVVKTDFSRYGTERAGRYFVEPDQRRALDEFLSR